jgi:hypothetical protein
VWPIFSSAGKRPAGWPGWPDGKQFALVLTHDVESLSGLNKCERLMEMEQSLGFRSSFNFIPEGEYRVSPELREHLVEQGFEVGVHDLRHDGKLYRTKRHFDAAAPRINDYLREWNASGFRSGFMHRNLDWLHSLDIQYDMSTFDTDPFEPQPDGVHTIFPFVVRNGQESKGYVEMPYTLPQDSTLYLVLQEKDDRIWKEKLDWIVEQGGMALLNVHPDYMSFDSPRRENEYPAEIYREFLDHVRSRYHDSYWAALPSDVATFSRGLGNKMNAATRTSH